MKYIKINAANKTVELKTFPEGKDRLKVMQSEVGGLIEPFLTHENHDTIYCNEEFLYSDLPYGFMISDRPVIGNAIVCGQDSETGETVDVKSSELEIALDIKFGSILSLQLK